MSRRSNKSDASRRVPDDVVLDVVEEARQQGVVMTRGGSPRRPPRARRPPVPPSRERYLRSHPEISVRVPTALKAELEARAHAEGSSLSRWTIDHLTGALASQKAAEASAYTKGRSEGDQAGYRRGRMDGWAAGYDRGHSEGKTAGLLLGIQAGEARGTERGLMAGLVAAILAARSGRNLDVALANFARHLQGRPELAAVIRTMVSQMGLAAQFDLLLKHGQYVDPSLASFFESLGRLGRPG